MRHVHVRSRVKKVPGSGSIAQESIVLTVVFYVMTVS